MKRRIVIGIILLISASSFGVWVYQNKVLEEFGANTKATSWEGGRKFDLRPQPTEEKHDSLSGVQRGNDSLINIGPTIDFK